MAAALNIGSQLCISTARSLLTLQHYCLTVMHGATSVAIYGKKVASHREKI